MASPPDQPDILLVHFLPRDETINSANYCGTKNKLRKVVHENKTGNMLDGVIMLHNNGTLHTVRTTQEPFWWHGWEVLQHPTHSHDLEPQTFITVGTILWIILLWQ
jgi:hypothetical protein